MATADATDYGTQFAQFYDRLYPRDGESVAAAAAFLAGLHRPELGPPLELGVGTGRIAVPLSQRVGPVVGVDPSPEMLELLAGQEGEVEGVIGDMRDYEPDRAHGLVCCVLASLTILSTRTEQRAALRAMAAAAEPGAAVVIETHNPDFVELLHEGRRMQTLLVSRGPDTGLLSQMTLVEAGGLWTVAHQFTDAGRVRFATETCLLVRPDLLDDMARKAGLECEARFGGWDGEEPGPRQPMVVSVYRRPG